MSASAPIQPSQPQLHALRSAILWPRVHQDPLAGMCPAKNMHKNEEDSQRGNKTTCHDYLQSRLCVSIADGWGRRRVPSYLKSFVRYALHAEPDGAGGAVTVPRLAWCLITSANYSKGSWRRTTRSSMSRPPSSASSSCPPATSSASPAPYP